MQVTHADVSFPPSVGERQHPRCHGSADLTGFPTAMVKIKSKSIPSLDLPPC